MAAGTPAHFLPWASLQGEGLREGWKNDLLGGLENQVGWASLKFPKNHLLLLQCLISLGQSVFARLAGVLPKVAYISANFKPFFQKV